MIYGVLDKDGENDVGQLAGSAATGTPIGTWASFEKDYAPNIEWLQGGTTFNPDTYPALAMYLGGNTIPERFDHSRLGAEETPQSRTLPSAPETAMTMPYDGIIRISCGRNNNFIYISSDNGVTWQPHQYWNSNGSSYTINIPFEVRKGDKIYVTDPSACEIVNVRYYKHPMFIKATPTSADSDYEGVLNGIRTYVRNSNSYSTEEQPTGGRWIDGKPIYRKVLADLDVRTSETVIGNIANADEIVKVEWKTNSYTTTEQGVLNYRTINTGNAGTGNVRIKANNDIIAFSGSGFDRVVRVVLEYTKTTDSPAT